jgi:hypothetical protein
MRQCRMFCLTALRQCRIVAKMQIVRTSPYLRKASKLLTEEELRAAEDEIAADPLRWPVIKGTGGCRKARAGRGGSGKRGGVRVIYFFRASVETIYMLTIYAKSERENLTKAEEKELRKAAMLVEKS